MYPSQPCLLLSPMELSFFNIHNHIDSLTMFAAHKFRVQPGVHNHLRHLDSDYPRAECKNITVIMLSGKLC